MRRALLVSGGALVLLQTAAAAVPSEPSVRRVVRREGLVLLEEAAAAARRLSYHGTQMVSFWYETGSSSALVRVVHVGGEGLYLRVAPTPQNPGGALYDDESGEAPELVGFARGSLDLLATNFDVAVEGSDEVAGRPAHVVVVRRPGASPSARFWIDRATRLPLRREVLDEAGRTIRESAFIQLTVGGAQVSDVVIEDADTMPQAHGARADVAALRAEGWHLPERLASGLELVDVRVNGAGEQTVLHLTYSDGLSTASVFQQRGVLDEDSVDGWGRVTVGGNDAWVQDAFPRRVVWAGDGMVFTVVADCPKATLDDLVGTLPHGNPGPSIPTRFGNGLARVGSWLNPFA